MSDVGRLHGFAQTSNGVKLRNNIYSTLAIVVFLALMLVVFLVYPTFTDIKKASREILSDKEKTAFLYAQSQEIGNFRKNFKEYETNLNEIETLFIDPQNPVDFIQFVEKTAASVNVTMDITLVSGTNKETTGSTPFSSLQIRVDGNFQNMANFSERLEKGPYLLQIQKLSISKSIQGSGKGKTLSNAVSSSFLVQVVNKQQ